MILPFLGPDRGRATERQVEGGCLPGSAWPGRCNTAGRPESSSDYNTLSWKVENRLTYPTPVSAILGRGSSVGMTRRPHRFSSNSTPEWRLVVGSPAISWAGRTLPRNATMARRRRIRPAIVVWQFAETGPLATRVGRNWKNRRSDMKKCKPVGRQGICRNHVICVHRRASADDSARQK
jgi:hypothetical protein